MSDKQHTIRQTATLSGVGLHTGATVKLQFCPAPSGTGIIFRRTDINPAIDIPADVDFVCDTARSTTLEKDGHRVSTVEHVLAAACGLQLDNLIIEIDGPEIPILDGSARMFTEALTAAGVIEQDADREYFELKTNVFYNDAARGVEIMAVPAEHLK
ncbi:MAG: UDP-3-O-acyl-N-acetylglucosamine deacetylase, partial [Bacteroidia bacterium]